MEAKKEKIAKVIARSGVSSRRQAEKLILEKRVTLNGDILENPAQRVDENDLIKIDGERIPQIEQTRIWKFYKPVGVVTTNNDEKQRKTVFDIIPSNLPRMVTIGRLDMNTEGLLLLTNNGSLAGKLENPKTGWKRKYKARVHGNLTDKKIKELEKGIEVEGIRYKPIIIEREPQKERKANNWVKVTLSEGKNREIRKAFEHIGLSVNRLIRVAYGPFQLGKMQKNEIIEIPTKVIKDQLGALIK